MAVHVLRIDVHFQLHEILIDEDVLDQMFEHGGAFAVVFGWRNEVESEQPANGNFADFLIVDDGSDSRRFGWLVRQCRQLRGERRGRDGENQRR